MAEGQIGLLIFAPVILAVAVALHRQGALGTAGLIAVCGATAGIAGFLVLNW